MTRHDCTSLHGSLQHITFIFRHGHSTLPPLSSFIAKFRNNFALCHPPHSVIECILWWKSVLSTQGTSHSLVPRRSVDPDIWVDASLTWGIGLIVSKQW